MQDGHRALGQLPGVEEPESIARVGVDHCLQIDLAHALEVTDEEGVLGQELREGSLTLRARPQPYLPGDGCPLRHGRDSRPATEGQGQGRGASRRMQILVRPRNFYSVQRTGRLPPEEPVGLRWNRWSNFSRNE